MEPKISTQIMIIQKVLDLFTGKGFIVYQEDTDKWLMMEDNRLITHDEALSLVVSYLNDAEIGENESEGAPQLYEIPLTKLSCGCCPLCGCTCTEEYLEEVRRQLS